jgi:hypothetical protein
MVVSSLSRRSFRALLLAAVPLVLCLGAAGCDQKTKVTSEAQPILAPVPVPAGLIGELTIAHPNTTWSKIRENMGGPLKFMPQSYPMLVTTLLGLPPQAADQIDADIPTYGAAISDGKMETPVLAIHVKSGAQLVALLTGGAEARYQAKVDGPSGVTLLEPKPGQTALEASLGVTGNYLLVGYAPDGILRVGPYAARTMPGKTAPANDALVVASHEALAGPLRNRMNTWWVATRNELQENDRLQREKHGGSAPSFGDPTAALQKADTTFQAMYAILGDLTEARVTLDLDDAGAHLRTGLKPQAPEGVAAREFTAMNTGSADGLLDMPADVSVAMMTRDSPEVREKTAADQGEAIEKLFAGKINDAEKKQIREVLASWSKGRGDWLFVGGALGQDGRALYARSAIGDLPTLQQGLKSTLDLGKVAAFADPLKHWLGDIKIGTPAPLPEGENGSWVKIERTPPASAQIPLEFKNGKPVPGKATRALEDAKGGKGKGDKDGKPEIFEVAWSFDKTMASYAVATNGREALKRIGHGTLRDDGEVKRAVDALKDETAAALLVLPMRLIGGIALPAAPSTRPPAAPMLIAIGKAGSEGWFRADAAWAAVREVAKVRPVQ